MKVNIEEIAKSPDKSLEVIFMDYIDEISSVDKISAGLTVKVNEYGANVSGDISAKIILQCDRCLNDYQYKIDIHIDENFVNDEIVPADQKEYELSESQFVEELRGRKEIDIKDLIFQSIILEIPYKRLCSVDCKGSEEMQKLASKNFEEFVDERLEVFKTFSENNFSDNFKK